MLNLLNLLSTQLLHSSLIMSDNTWNITHETYSSALAGLTEMLNGKPASTKYISLRGMKDLHCFRCTVGVKMGTTAALAYVSCTMPKGTTKSGRCDHLWMIISYWTETKGKRFRILCNITGEEVVKGPKAKKGGEEDGEGKYLRISC